MSENPVTPVSPVGREVDVEALAEQMHDAYERAAVSVGWSTQERSRVPWAEVPEANKETMRAMIREVVVPRLKAAESALEPGKAPAIVAAMFAEAQKRGHSPFSARHALSFLVEQLDEALAVVERVRAVAEGWKAIPKPQTGWSSGLSATEAGNRLGAWNVRRMHADEVLAALTPSAPTEESQA